MGKQIARAVFSTNISSRYIEHPQVTKTVEMLLPGYSPSSKRQISSALLEQIYKKYTKNISIKLSSNVFSIG